MNLKGFEMYANSGLPLTSVTVNLYAASDVQPNPGPVLATTTTNNQGMWQFTGIGSGIYDVQVVIPGIGSVKWYKGNSKVGLSELSLPAGGISAATIGAGGTANRALVTTDGTNTTWGQITSGMLGAEAVTHLGLANGATGAPTINAPNPGLLTDMQIGYTPTGGKVLMLFTGTFYASGSATITVYAYKDNVGLGQQRGMTVPNGSSYVTISLVHQFTPAAAAAAFQIYWSVSTGSATADGTSRQLTLLEIKA